MGQSRTFAIAAYIIYIFKDQRYSYLSSRYVYVKTWGSIPSNPATAPNIPFGACAERLRNWFVVVRYKLIFMGLDGLMISLRTEQSDGMNDSL